VAIAVEESWSPVLSLLEPDEQVHAQAAAEDAIMLVTDRRLAVATNDQCFALDIPFEHLRRVQFDIERSRPATLVLVPESPSDHPQVLAIAPDQYDATARALALLGKRIYGQP
jgi:hypothetical protein